MFPTYRKFFVLFGVLILFVMFFVNYWKLHAIETFKTTCYPDSYSYGKSINLDGRYSPCDPKRYQIKTPGIKTHRKWLDQSTQNYCDSSCQRQDECVQRNGNKCISKFRKGKCYCKFSKNLNESFQNREQTMANLERIYTNLPNSSKPSWVHSKTNNNSAEIGKETIVMTDLKINDLNKMTISFRMSNKTTTSSVGKIPIISFVSPGGTYDFITKNYNTLEINTPQKMISIMLDSTEKPITITKENGLYKVYENGMSSTSNSNLVLGNIPTALVISNDTNLVLNSTNTSGIFMRDLRTFNQSLTEDDVKMLFVPMN